MPLNILTHALLILHTMTNWLTCIVNATETWRIYTTILSTLFCPVKIYLNVLTKVLISSSLKDIHAAISKLTWLHLYNCLVLDLKHWPVTTTYLNFFILIKRNLSCNACGWSLGQKNFLATLLAKACSLCSSSFSIPLLENQFLEHLSDSAVNWTAASCAHVGHLNYQAIKAVSSHRHVCTYWPWRAWRWPAVVWWRAACHWWTAPGRSQAPSTPRTLGYLTHHTLPQC